MKKILTFALLVSFSTSPLFAHNLQQLIVDNDEDAIVSWIEISGQEEIFNALKPIPYEKRRALRPVIINIDGLDPHFTGHLQATPLIPIAVKGMARVFQALHAKFDADPFIITRFYDYEYQSDEQVIFVDTPLARAVNAQQIEVVREIINFYAKHDLQFVQMFISGAKKDKENPQLCKVDAPQLLLPVGYSIFNEAFDRKHFTATSVELAKELVKYDAFIQAINQKNYARRTIFDDLLTHMHLDEDGKRMTPNGFCRQATADEEAELARTKRYAFEIFRELFNHSQADEAEKAEWLKRLPEMRKIQMKGI